MTRVKRGGRELIVDDAVVTEYLGNGYSVIDDRGQGDHARQSPRLCNGHARVG